MLVLIRGSNVSGEGMGIGAVALECREGFFFAKNCSTMVFSPHLVRKIFQVDSRMSWERKGIPTVPLTRVLDLVSDIYMKMPFLQPLLAVSSPVRTALGITPSFEPVPPIAEARFMYRREGDTIEVSCTITPREPGITRIFLLNELAADSFTRGFHDGNPTPPPTGWQEHVPGHDLYDPVRGIRFGISSVAPGERIPGKVFWGREHTKELCWAGFGIELGTPGDAQEPVSCSYSIPFSVDPGDGGAAK
ncbi:hypothetical protein J2741_002597 [Methanolinea mesophila]|uniref:hypothetical protein n=1 Tax=Methanolinea mesophila TaxID=547055 RepID=UPI001AE405D7|nr:hypothetical protein [Methanolinea mesophila]MBP1930001.1 hypothetical protein [Methanolinea mesophila]